MNAYTVFVRRRRGAGLFIFLPPTYTFATNTMSVSHAKIMSMLQREVDADMRRGGALMGGRRRAIKAGAARVRAQPKDPSTGRFVKAGALLGGVRRRKPAAGALLSGGVRRRKPAAGALLSGGCGECNECPRCAMAGYGIYGGASEEAKARAKAKYAVLKGLIEQYKLDQGKYPSKVDLVTLRRAAGYAPRVKRAPGAARAPRVKKAADPEHRALLAQMRAASRDTDYCPPFGQLGKRLSNAQLREYIAEMQALPASRVIN